MIFFFFCVCVFFFFFFFFFFWKIDFDISYKLSPNLQIVFLDNLKEMSLFSGKTKKNI